MIFKGFKKYQHPLIFYILLILLPALVCRDYRLIHPQFNSVGTDTRRPTGASPNLLQLSKKGDGIKVRRCFLPNKKLGHDLICSLDWDGEELRVIAGLSGDKELSSCYVGNNLKDVHSIVAAQIKGCSYEEFVSIRKGSQGAEKGKEYENISNISLSTGILS